jgi:hypothetical protein
MKTGLEKKKIIHLGFQNFANLNNRRRASARLQPAKKRLSKKEKKNFPTFPQNVLKAFVKTTNRIKGILFATKFSELIISNFSVGPTVSEKNLTSFQKKR